MSDKQIYKIVLTGGPCAGKTTALKAVIRHFTALGFRVLAVSETASDLLCSGISPFNMDNVTFQYIVTSTMRYKESMMHLAAETVPEDKVLIVCDRAQMDNSAYMTDDEFSRLTERMNTNIVEMRDGYDAVFHLETSAKGDANAYSTNFATNAARYESIAEAIKTDSDILRGWVGHPHLRVIPSDSDFDAKIAKLIREVEQVIVHHRETERKYLIERPSEETLRSLPFARFIDIEQVYAEYGGEEIRVRRRGEGGHYIYVKTLKRGKGVTREETEERVDEEFYETIKRGCTGSVEKTRVCIVDNDRYYELDLYPYSDKLAILEIELCDEKETAPLPDFLHVIAEVTDDRKYSNSTIAVTHSLE